MSIDLKRHDDAQLAEIGTIAWVSPLPAEERLSQSYTQLSTATPRQATLATRVALTKRKVDQRVIDEACAVTYELADNACRHSGSVMIRTTLTLGRDGIDVAVYDQGRVFDLDLNGGGFAIVGKLAGSVEILPGPGGKTVHATIGYGGQR